MLGRKAQLLLMNTPVDTITAQATPPGRGGIAIVRVSGPLVPAICAAILGVVPAPRKALHQAFYADNNEILDEGVAIYFPNPHSFTGEDVLELQGHGGPVVVDMLLKRVLALGARMARPGEFSERAFLNGKMDLAQAEAVADLINASSTQAARSALRSLQGEFSNVVRAVTEQLIQLRVYVEAAIDFTDEEIDFLSDTHIASNIDKITAELHQIRQKAQQGSLLREGITAVIIGEPNVGKSSLLNALSGKQTAIVTDIPGTTRDVLRDYILIDGMPMHIVDTAGLRESDDVVELEGIRRAHHEMEQADIILYVIDGSKQTANIADIHLPTILSARPVILVQNKIDLTNTQPDLHKQGQHTVISLSAKSQQGIDLLKNYIRTQAGLQEQTEGIYLARRRHLDALARAEQHVATSYKQLEKGAGELAAEDLRLAQLALAEITGEFTADDLLGRIFSSFCIGK